MYNLLNHDLLNRDLVNLLKSRQLAYKAPLYGRRTAQYKIQPFDFFEACECFPRLSAEDKVYAYAIAGGTPQYALKINDRLSVKQNICDLYLDPSSSLFEEPTNLLKREIRETAVYNAIISLQNASGQTSM